MTAAKNDLVQRAVERLNATQISPRRWAYYADEVSSWFVVSSADMQYLGELLADDAYSHWCAGTVAREMPQGWQPEGT